MSQATYQSISAKEFRQNFRAVATAVKQGTSFQVIYRSKPLGYFVPASSIETTTNQEQQEKLLTLLQKLQQTFQGKPIDDYKQAYAHAVGDKHGSQS